MDFMRWLDVIIDWCTPEAVKADTHVKKRVRMFLMSHLFGPVLSSPIR